MVKSFFSLLFLLAFVTSTHAQIGATALVKTTFTDAKTGQPVSLKYELIPASGGAKIRGGTPANGTFEQILKPGETYKVNCKMTDGIAAPLSFTLRESGSYYEQSQTLPVKIMKKGDALGEWMVFAPAKSILSSEKELVAITEMIAGNRSLFVTVSVGGDVEVKAKTKGKPAKKAKPAKKSKTPVAKLPVVDIIAERVAAMNAYFAQNMKPEALKRVTVKADASRAGANAWAIVGDIKSMDM